MNQPKQDNTSSPASYQGLDSPKYGSLVSPKSSEYYDTSEIDDFAISTRAFGGKSKGGKGRNKREVRAANSGRTCYSAKHVRILTNKQKKLNN